jgi:hypothetical protein
MEVDLAEGIVFEQQTGTDQLHLSKGLDRLFQKYFMMMVLLKQIASK